MIASLALEIFLLLLVFFVVGCIIGCIARRNWDLFFRNPEASPVEAREPLPASAEVPAAAASADEGPDLSMPESLKQPRADGPDDLKRISGIGPVIEKKLNALGYYHFDQIVDWSPENVAWVDDNLNFKGRIDRDNWIGQAKNLARGGTG